MITFAINLNLEEDSATILFTVGRVKPDKPRQDAAEVLVEAVEAVEAAKLWFETLSPLQQVGGKVRQSFNQVGHFPRNNNENEIKKKQSPTLDAREEEELNQQTHLKTLLLLLFCRKNKRQAGLAVAGQVRPINSWPAAGLKPVRDFAKKRRRNPVKEFLLLHWLHLSQQQ